MQQNCENFCNLAVIALIIVLMKLAIGIIGEKGSGKGTCVEILRDIAKVESRQPIDCVKSSDILAETLTLWDLSLTRSNLQQLAIIMNAKYGDHTLSNAIKNRIGTFKTNIIIYEGIRWPSDVEMIRSFPNNLLIYITAPTQIRYERTLRRNEKVGESTTTLEQFLAEEKVATETQIIKLAQQADISIVNDNDINSLKSKIHKIWIKNISEKL